MKQKNELEIKRLMKEAHMYLNKIDTLLISVNERLVSKQKEAA